MKKYFFISGLPRAGNTLLSTLLNQNPDIIVSGQSIVPEIFFRIEEIKKTQWFENFPNEKSLENVSKNILNNYYKNQKAKYIGDRGPWCSEYNFSMLKIPCLNSLIIFSLFFNYIGKRVESQVIKKGDLSRLFSNL